MQFPENKMFKRDGDNIIFIGQYMELYVPYYYFKNDKLAEQVGDNFNIFGLVSMRTFNDPDGKSPNQIRLLNIPVKIMTYPAGYEVRKMDLHSSEGPEAVPVLKYYSNDILCGAYLPKVTTTFKDFLALLIGGKVPPFTPYPEVMDILKKNMEIAGINFDLSDTTYEIVVAEIYRSKSNPSKKFSYVMGKDPKHSNIDYVTFSPRELTKSNSTFTGVIFEDMDQMLTSGINRTVQNKPETVSPMEEIIKY